MSLEVAIVSRDAEVRAAAARTFAAAPPDWSIRLCAEDPGDADVVIRGTDVAAPGTILFDPARPDDALRAVATASGPGRVYAVVASVGGAGATTIALHLGAALRACYAELTSPSARLGLPDDARTWLPDDEDLERSALPVAGGLRVLRSPLPCPGAGAFPLEAARSVFDRLVLDAGTQRDVGPLLAASSAAVVVTTPTRPGALAARALTEEHPGVRWVVVVNRLGPGGQIMRAALEQLLARPVAVELACCPALRDAEDEARLLNGGWRRWFRGVAALARALERC
jgi:hypothetical protein